MIAGKPVEEGVLTIGTLGHPNVGKSSLINSLIGKKVVSVSRYCRGLKIPELMRLWIDRNVSWSNSSLPVLRIRDPVPFRPLDPGWVKNQQGIRIRDKQPGSYCRELRNKFFLVKILKFFDMHPGSRTWDGKNLDPVSWIRDGKHSDSGFRIRDKHPRSAKLEIFVAKFART